MKTDLILREPELYFDSIHNELNNFLRDTVLHPAFSHQLSMKKSFNIWRPAVEIKQTETDYKVKVQLPGVKLDDIDVELDNDFMTITAEIEEEKEEKEEKEKNLKYHTYVNLDMVNINARFLLTSLFEQRKLLLITKTVSYQLLFQNSMQKKLSRRN